MSTPESPVLGSAMIEADCPCSQRCDGSHTCPAETHIFGCFRSTTADDRRERSELEALRRWKRQATIVLDQWEDVWVSAGRPGRLGFSKPAAVQDEIARLRERARHV